MFSSIGICGRSVNGNTKPVIIILSSLRGLRDRSTWGLDCRPSRPASASLSVNCPKVRVRYRGRP